MTTLARALVLAVAMSAGAFASPAGAGEVEIERMTWIEVRAAVEAGSTTVIVPSGGTEQNGRHMVIGKHNLIVAETARRTARALGDALVAPVLAYVPEGDVDKREGNMAFPGTISVPPSVFEGVLEAAAHSFKAHGFKTIVLMGDHGQSQAPQQAVARRLSAVWAADGVRVVSADAYYGRNGALDWLAAQPGFNRAAFGSHAGIQDTAELMAVAPHGVRLEGYKANSDGATGDASKASRELGEKLVELKVAAAVAEIRAARAASAAVAPEQANGLLARLKRLIFG
jgi:creatinine amidohydrolase/Fe(II)-dependent formamide hydrolase-like protein